MCATDEQLAEIVAQRDQSDQALRAARDGLGLLYERHAAPLLAFLAARARGNQLEDVCQEVWKRAWEHLPRQFRGGNFRAWLYQIARNYLIDLARKPSSEPLPEENLVLDMRRRPEEALAEQERLALLQRCLERLDPQAARLVQARLAGQAYPEICAILGVEVQRAHRLFHQAKEELQTCIERASA